MDERRPIARSAFSDWLADLAAARPDPGGGSAAAVMLALGAALAEMVAGYPGSGSLDDEAVLAAALRSRALNLVEADADASRRLVVAWRGSAPAADLVAAAVEAARTSADIVAVARDAEPLLGRLRARGNPVVVADVAVAATAYAAATRSALVNLVTNLASARATAAPEIVADADGLGRVVGPADALAVRLDDLAHLVRADLVRAGCAEDSSDGWEAI